MLTGRTLATLRTPPQQRIMLSQNNKHNVYTATLQRHTALAERVRAKLAACAHTGQRSGYDLRRMVGHANMLDDILDDIDRMTLLHKQQQQQQQNSNSADLLYSATANYSYGSAPSQEEDSIPRSFNQESVQDCIQQQHEPSSIFEQKYALLFLDNNKDKNQETV